MLGTFFKGLLLASLAVLAGCGSPAKPDSSSPTSPTAPGTSSVTISPAAQTIDQGHTASFTATVSNDSSNSGVSWSLSGVGNLSASTTSGVVYNAPATVFSSTTATLTAISLKSTTQTQSVTITVNATLVVSSDALPGGTMNVPYSASLVSMGGIAPIAWSLSAGTLPSGLTMSPAGVLSGTPTVTGTTSFTVTAIDSSSPALTATRQVTVAIAAPPLTITTTALPGVIQGAPYSAALASTGGLAPINWSVRVGSLPAGITLSSAGVLSGMPSVSGSFSFTVMASDSSTTPMTATQALSEVITAKLAIPTTTLPPGGATQAYGATTLQAIGGTKPITWTVSSGNPPAGITLSSAGSLSGTPTTTGTASFTVTATDSGTGGLQQSAAQALTLTINPSWLTITTTTLPGVTQGAMYLATLSSTGGLPPITWSVSTGTLPDGITLSSAGVFSGRPITAGTTWFTVKATDSGTGGSLSSATQALGLTVNPLPLTIANGSLPGGVEGSAYSQSLQSVGGTGAVTWSLLSGSLPTGLSLDASGTITGTSMAQAVSSFTVKAVDSGSPQQSATQPLTITINPATPVAIQTALLFNGTVGINYQGPISVTGGVAPYVLSTTAGSVPAGLNIGACSGICNFNLNGTPTTAGTSTFTFKVTDAENPAQTSSQAYSITINPAGSVSIASMTLTGTVNFPYNTTLQANSGTQPYTWSIVAGGLPAWASLNSSTGAISGTPTTAGPSTFTVQVTDSTSPTRRTATQQFTLTILPAGPNNGGLKGSYAFRFGGFANGNARGSAYAVDLVGSFIADGNGNITSGQIDSNQSEGPGGKTGFSESAVMGIYSIGADNRGTIVFSPANTTLAVAVGDVSGGVAQTLRLIEFDDNNAGAPSGVVGSGEARLQVPSAFSLSTIKGNFVFGFEGESACNTCGAGGTTIIPYGPVSAVGVFTADGNGNITAGQEDAAGVATSYNDITLTGSVTAPSTSTGYGTITLTPAGTAYPAAPTHFAYYVVNSSEIYMMSTDSHATTTLLSGDVLLQQRASFSNSSLSGASVGYEVAGNNGDGSSLYPNQSQATLLLFAVTGSGQLTIFQDINSAGKIKSGTEGSFSYSIAANGRMTINATGGGTPVIYLVNNNQGFGTGQPTSGGDTPGLLTLEAQVGAPFSNTTLSGNYFFGNLPQVVSSPASSGMFAFNTGSGTITADNSGAGGTLLSGQRLTFTSSTDPATGQATLTDNTGGTNIVYIISPTRAVMINTNTSNTTPTVTVIEK